MKIALVQTALFWEDSSKNLQQLAEKITAVEAVDLIVLPEMFSTGFSMRPAALAQTMDGEAVNWMRQTAAKKNCALCGSLIIQENNTYYNRLIWATPDGTIATYDKRHLFALSDEPHLYGSGKERLIVEWKGWKICPMICFDLRFPVWSRNTGGAYELLIYVANWPERRNTAWKTLLQARAIENQAYVIGVNRVGNDGNNIYHSGDSMVIDPMGTLLFHQAHDEVVHIAELHLEQVQQVRTQLPFLSSADSFQLK